MVTETRQTGRISMKSKLATALLVAAFLSAGAFASDRSGNINTPVRLENHTVIAKNQSWPPRPLMTMEPCARRPCLSI
jgi:hypothetical protein